MEISTTMRELIAELNEQAQSRKNTDTNNIGVRLPLSMIQKIDEATDKFKVTRTDIIKNAVSMYLTELKNNF